ncbi:hypothetical protein AB0M46_00135 [Dactylosporangium sp. NPDC051485]|uniref:hypothetical protein n=1 Tax=Dactylosporangium sp. NPDC051485 TaxID=3154846 RepID=UPI003436273D
MGHMIAGFRTHPYHDTPITQAAVAGWAHLTQAQISRLERQPTDRQPIDRLIFWAQLLHIPPALLWFTLPNNPQASTSEHDIPAGARPGPIFPTRLAARLDRLYVDKGTTSDHLTAEDNDTMRRRTVLAGLIGALSSPYGSLAQASPSETTDLDQIEAQVAKVRRGYQHGRYENALRQLPTVLAALAGAQAESREPRIAELAAQAYQVASGLCLKSDDVALSAVAADRSMAAAENSGEPLVIASSVRAVVHSLLAGGHPARAANLAAVAADRLAADAGLNSKPALSVHGALLLRGAVAAAHAEDRDLAGALLDEAAASAAHLGHDGNACWTAFGPTNVLVHRVAVAVELGDAGTAVDLAETVNLKAIAVPERQAMLMLDTARALTQWGKCQRALDAIRTAEAFAPEEVRSRRSVHQLINELGRRCPDPLRRQVQDYARAVGAAA